MAQSNNDRVTQLVKIQHEGRELFTRKNQDYGDAFATYGPVGVLVRIGDKINRFSSISSNGIKMVDNEGLRDTLIDLHNYAAMAIMLIDENKQKLNHSEIENVKQLISQGTSIHQIIDLGYCIDVLKSAGVHASTLRSSNISAKTLFSNGYTTSQLREAGFNYTELIIAGCPIHDFKLLGFTNTLLHDNGFRFDEIFDINIDIAEMQNGFNVYEMKIMDSIYSKKLSELRRFDDDSMTSIEGGNRSAYVHHTSEASSYVNEAKTIFRKEYASYVFLNEH